jgi:hypothetical protein
LKKISKNTIKLPIDSCGGVVEELKAEMQHSLIPREKNKKYISVMPNRNLNELLLYKRKMIGI